VLGWVESDEFQVSRVPGFQDYGGSGFQGSRVPGFQDSRIPGFQRECYSKTDENYDTIILPSWNKTFYEENDTFHQEDVWLRVSPAGRKPAQEILRKQHESGMKVPRKHHENI